MKIVIDIDEDYYELIKFSVEHGDYYKLYTIIANGKHITEGNLISRSALKEEFKKIYHVAETAEQLANTMEDAIDNAPTINAVPMDLHEKCMDKAVRGYIECQENKITDEDIQNAIKQGYNDGYEMAKAKFERPKGECEKCTYRIFTEKFSDSIAEVMTLYGITSIEELQARLQEEMRGKEE